MTTATLEREPHRHRFTREEYYAMGDAGLFEERRVELIDGEVIDMSPQKAPHAFGISCLTEIFFKGLTPGLAIRVQLPLNVGDQSEPEPDIAIVKGLSSDFKIDHPTSAELVVEFANASANFDRARKGSIYARAAIPEFWLFNIPQRCVEVYRKPNKAKKEPYGFKYSDCQIAGSGEIVSPLCLPGVRIKVKDLLP